MKTIYLEHRIKSLDDLPKEEGKYWVKDEAISVIQKEKFELTDKYKSFWIDMFEYWLEPVEVPELSLDKMEKIDLIHDYEKESGTLFGAITKNCIYEFLDMFVIPKIKSKLKIFN